MDGLKDIIFQSICFLVLGIIVHILTLKLKFKHNKFNLNVPRKDALYAIAATCVSIFLITIIVLFSSNDASKSSIQAENNIVYNLGSVLSNAISYLVIMSPILLIKKLFKQSWSSTGISKHNLKKSMSAGIITGIICLIACLLYMNVSIIKVITHLNINDFWALLYFIVVGFSEEFVFRGYLQTRLIAYVGRNKGWITTSALMVLMHLPQRIFIEGLSLSQAFTSTFNLVFLSLFLGYIMIKTENVVASAIFHTLYDWGITLG